MKDKRVWSPLEFTLDSRIQTEGQDDFENRFLADIWDEEEKAFNPEQIFEQVSKRF